MKKRIDELDMVKGICIIYVFFRHITELVGVNIFEPGFYSVFNCCTESVMFLFVMLSGYVFKSKGNIGQDIKNKFKQMLIPYLIYCTFFNVTYFIRYVLIDGMEISTFLRNALSNYIAKPNLEIPGFATGPNMMRYAVVPYWYIAEIFMAFILFIIVYKFVGNKKLYTRIIAVLCLLAGNCVLMYLDVRNLLLDTFTSDASYFTVMINIVGFAGILMIGSILREFRIFDMEAHSKRFRGILFAVCLIGVILHIAFYNNQYALQFGKWGQRGVWSVGLTTLVGFALTYSLIFISYYIKRLRPLKTALMFLGANTLDILLLHFGIGELLCMIFGFWVPVYDVAYPAETFAWWHMPLVSVVTAALVLGYVYMKKMRKMKKRS